MGKKNEYRYQPLDSTVAFPRDMFCQPCLISSGVFLLLCVWIASLAMVYQLRPPVVSYSYNEQDDRTYECGSTVAEAIAAGCQFDPVSFAWLPERCLDRELAADLTGTTPWTLHSDPDARIKKSDMDFSRNETTTYITNANHILHCLYSWRRLHRLLLAGKPYHSGLSYGHTVHCTNTVLDAIQKPADEIRNIALVVIPAC